MTTENNISVDLYPGSMGLVGLCWELVGGDHVIGGEWLGPVTLKNITQGELTAIIELAEEQGVTLTAKERIDFNASNNGNESA